MMRPRVTPARIAIGLLASVAVAFVVAFAIGNVTDDEPGASPPRAIPPTPIASVTRSGVSIESLARLSALPALRPPPPPPTAPVTPRPPSQVPVEPAPPPPTPPPVVEE